MAKHLEQRRRLKTDPNHVHLSLSDAYALLSGSQGNAETVVNAARGSMAAPDGLAANVHEETPAPG